MWGDRRFREIMNYGQGERGRCGLLAVSIGTVRTHLVSGTEHLRTDCTGSCPWKVFVLYMSLHRGLYPLLAVRTLSATAWYTLWTEVSRQDTNRFLIVVVTIAATSKVKNS